MASIRYQEWSDQHAKNNYPFSDAATLEAKTGEVIPKDIFIDGGVQIVGGVAPFYIYSMVRSGAEITLNIRDQESTGLGAYAARVTFDPADQPSKLVLTDSYGRESGMLVVNPQRITELTDLVGDKLEFEEEALEFVAAVSVPLPAFGVRGFILEDGTTFFGDVVLAGENGVVVSEDDGAIRIDIVGDPYYDNACVEERGITPEPFCGLKTINGIGPDSDGDFKLTPGSKVSSDSVLRIEPTINGIKISTVPEGGNA